jgi:hypothetical protein
MANVDKRSKEYRYNHRPSDILQRAKDRYSIMAEADRHNREDAMEDIRFVNLPGAQWDENMKNERGDRPCYEYNKTRIRCKRVINDMRANRPSGKVRGVEGGDPKVAEIYEGLIRNIWNTSHGDTATDYAAEYQVEGGMGAWRLDTEYSDDTAFDQDVAIKMLENPMSLYADPSAQDMMKRDAKDWVYTNRISHEEFEQEYGMKVEKVDFENSNEFEDDEDDEWTDEETVRIAEYWYKVPAKKTLWLMDVPDTDAQPDQTGQQPTKRIVVDSESDEAQIMTAQGFTPERTREVDGKKIMMVVVSGADILEGPTEWNGSKFPWVMVHGEYKVIEGRTYWWGLVRHAKDAQRNYNISKTSIAETIAQTPKAKYWATSTQAAGHSNEWAEADKKNFPFQLYEADPLAPGAPQKMGGADVPVALMSQASVDNEDLKDVMGLPDESMGDRGSSVSGRAIYARQQQGEIATFNYKDNMSAAVEYTMELMIDLIPHVYDADRELRILGSDGSEDYKRINQVVYDEATGTSVRVNDMSAGRYDITVTSGPSFSTQRQEAAETYMNLMQGNPEIMQIAGDLVFKSVDLPYAEDISERLRAMLPPQIQQQMDSETEVTPEIQQMMQQVQQAMQQVQEYGQLVQAAAQELEEEKSTNAQHKAEIKAAMAQLKQAEAEFNTRIAQAMAGLVKEGAGLTKKEAVLLVKSAETGADVGLQDSDDGALNVSTRVDGILSQFMQQADQAIGAMKDRKVVGGKTTREGGKLTAEVEFDDGTTKSVAAVREQGGLRIVPAEE